MGQTYFGTDFVPGYAAISIPLGEYSPERLRVLILILGELRRSESSILGLSRPQSSNDQRD